MKFILALTSLLGAAVAFESSGSQERTARLRNRASRPEKLASVEVRSLEYRTSIGSPTEQRSKALLTRVPGLKRRGGPQASDFFECTNPVRIPSFPTSINIRPWPRLILARTRAPPLPTARSLSTKSYRPTTSSSLRQTRVSSTPSGRARPSSAPSARP